MKNLYSPVVFLLWSLTSYAQQSPYYRLHYDIPGVSGQSLILDYKDNRLLYWSDSAYFIHHINTTNTARIPLSQPPPPPGYLQEKRGWLTDSGAFITVAADIANQLTLYEWHGQTLTQLEQNVTKLETAGNDVLWTSGDSLFHHETGAATTLVTPVAPGAFTVAAEGWYLYSVNDTLFRHQNGVTKVFATGEQTSERFWFVQADGPQVLYLMQKAAQSPTLYLYNGAATETVAILAGYHHLVFPKRQYALNNGYVSYVSVDVLGQWPPTIARTTIHLRKPDGSHRVAFEQYGARNVSYVLPELWGILENGGIVVAKDDYQWQNGLHYVPLDSITRYIARFPWNGRSVVPPFTYKDASFYTFYNDTVYRVALDTLYQHSVQSFEVHVLANTPYHLTLEKLLEHYSGIGYGPGQLSSISFFQGPNKGNFIVGKDTLDRLRPHVARTRMDSLWYAPNPGETGLDSVEWRADNGLSGTNAAWIKFRIYQPGGPANVTLTSNINIINNNRDTVILTAHGGPGLFTFARNATFSDILRTESPDSVLRLLPSDFRQGNNDVYVRLKVAGTADSVDTDQVRIIKTFLSEIPGKDVDNVHYIVAYPNPFSTQFTVEGLKPSKRYILTLHDLTGRALVNVFVNYQHKYTVVPNVPLRRGVYFLKVWDVDAQKTAGGAVLLKM